VTDPIVLLGPHASEIINELINDAGFFRATHAAKIFHLLGAWPPILEASPLKSWLGALPLDSAGGTTTSPSIFSQCLLFPPNLGCMDKTLLMLACHFKLNLLIPHQTATCRRQRQTLVASWGTLTRWALGNVPTWPLGLTVLTLCESEEWQHGCLQAVVSVSGDSSVSRDVFLEKSIGSLCRDSSASTVASRRMLRSSVTASSSTAGDADITLSYSTTNRPLQPVAYLGFHFGAYKFNSDYILTWFGNCHTCWLLPLRYNDWQF